ncbi:MAG: LCP family protein [Mycobacteriales bacterium]
MRAPTRVPPRPVARRGGRGKKVSLWILALVVAAIVGIVGSYLFNVQRFNANVARMDVFAGLSGRPAAGVSGAQNFLLIGSDSRDGTLPGDNSKIATQGGTRSDTLMLLHINKSHDRAYLISIPRDSYVSVPPAGPWGGGRTKINAAFSYGGARHVVKTVEGFSDVRIDHVVLINFAGFRQMTDAVGGVNVVVNKTTYDPETHATFRAGVNHLNGAEALLYVRQRHGLPGGDFDRAKRQQQFMRALVAQATATGTLANPKKFADLLSATSKAIVVDKELNMASTAAQFRALRTNNLSFITLPNLGSASRGGSSVVLVDRTKALAMFAAINSDTMSEWLKTNPANNVTRGN